MLAGTRGGNWHSTTSTAASGTSLQEQHVAPLHLSFAPPRGLRRGLRSCCLSCAALSLSHSVSLPVPSLLLVFPEKKVQFQRSVNGECPSSSSMPIFLGLSTCSSFPCFWNLPRGREEGTAGLEGTSSKPYHPQTPFQGWCRHLLATSWWEASPGSC